MQRAGLLTASAAAAWFRARLRYFGDFVFLNAYGHILATRSTTGLPCHAVADRQQTPHRGEGDV